MPVTKYVFTLLLLSVCFVSISWIFWEVDIQYRKPTPVPNDFQPVGQVHFSNLDIQLEDSDKNYTLIHFYNPDCPCSKFNLKHIKELQFKYGSKLNIVAVVPPWGDLKKAENQCKFMNQVLLDDDYQLAQTCGVYSTPQAVLFNPLGQMVYKGNYNLNRYCTNKETQFVRLALEQSLADEPSLTLAQQNLPAYGCSIFNCNNQLK